MMKRICCFFFTIIPGFSMGGDGLLNTKESDASLLPELVKVVDTFADENNLQFSDVTKLLNRFVFEQELIAKGGLGALGKKSYLDLTSSKNKIFLADGREWIGGDNSVQQVIFLLNGKVVERSSEVGVIDSLTVVMFSSERIQTYDLKRLVGGYFIRREAERRN
ncbi:hypothetical protein ACJJIE_06455 [Microbulbifer sp. TRSA001]|uniref:hypothetical protein n=1 Tax=Microbulbifer sp. TRSA001 TaxID=3243381 RepID=UPI00403A4CEF